LTASLNRVENNQPSAQPLYGALFGSQLALVQTYNSVQLGVDWRFAETWRVSTQAEAIWTRQTELVSQPAHSWRVSLSLTWTPRPLVPAFWP
jgi:hypothetical protein